MQFEVEIQPSGVTFLTENNVLEDALSKSIPLEHSCKNGTCGVCSAEIVSGEVENKEGQVVNIGKILTCCSKAKSNLVLIANYYPELVDIKQKTLPCKVASFDYVTDDIVVIRFRFPPKANFDYLPGQYVDLSFQGVRRSYSIANAKQESKEIELHIRKVPNGQMSALLFGQLKDNQLMRIEGPKGTFFIREGDKPLILLAGGTGIAPVKAILEQLNCENDLRDIYVYWGMPSIKAFYLEIFDEVSAMRENVHYVPVLSGDESWEGRTGLVHQAVFDDFDSLEEYEVYACGSPLMIEAAKDLFLKKGLPESAFFSDAFTPAI
jgi:CDP-4-dehydro-6-deoxyglucose reductase